MPSPKKNETKKQAPVKPEVKETKKQAPVKPAVKEKTAEEKLREKENYHPNPSSSMLPPWIMTNGDYSILKQYYEVNKDKLEKDDKEFLKGQMTTAWNYDLIENNAIGEIENPFYKKQERPEQHLYRKGNVVKLDNIHLDKHQTATNGCWSVSYQLLLQSRGLDLDQKQIRSFRPEFTIEQGKSVDMEQYKKHNYHTSQNPYEHSDLLMKTMPNTAMCETTYNIPYVNNVTTKTGRNLTEGQKKEYIKQYKTAMIASIKEKITKAIEVDRSPVAISYGGHFRTVVGINKKDGTLYLKDSIPVDGSKPNDEIKVKIKDIVSNYITNPELLYNEDNYGKGGITINWVKDIKPPVATADNPNPVTKVNDNISYDKDGNLVYTSTPASASDLQSEEGMARSGHLRGREVKSNIHFNVKGKNFQVYGFGVHEDVVMAYEGVTVPKKLAIPGKRYERETRPVQKYEPSEFELVESMLDRFKITTTNFKVKENKEKLKNADIHNFFVYDEKINSVFKTTFESAQKKLEAYEASNDAEKAAKIREDIAKAKELQEKHLDQMTRYSLKYPNERISASQTYEEYMRSSKGFKTLDEYKESFYRSLTYDMLKKQYALEKGDTPDDIEYKTNMLGAMLIPENFDKNVKQVKELLGGKGLIEGSDFKEFLDEKIEEAFRKGKGISLKDISKSSKTEEGKKADDMFLEETKILLNAAVHKLVDRLYDVKTPDDPVTVQKIAQYDMLRNLTDSMGLINKIDPKIQTSKQVIKEVQNYKKAKAAEQANENANVNNNKKVKKNNVKSK